MTITITAFERSPDRQAFERLIEFSPRSKASSESFVPLVGN